MSETPQSWQEVRESRVGFLRIAIFVFFLKFFGMKISRALVFVVFLCAFPFLKTPRKISAQFLSRVHAQTGKKFSVFKHLLSFANALLDKLAAWTGKIRAEDFRQKTPESWRKIAEETAKNRGVFLICSHLGNIEMLRAAFLSFPRERPIPLNIIMSVSSTENFNAIMRRLNPAAGESLISVHSVGMETAMLAAEKISHGEIVIMAGDRVLGNSARGSTKLPFLGVPAAFPDGVFRFASALECPVFATFLIPGKRDGVPELFLIPLDVPAGTPPRDAAKIRQREFVGLLEKTATENPYQWFNFFDFWHSEHSEISQNSAQSSSR